MDFIFDDNDTACVCCVDYQIVCGLQVDDADVTPERIHQVGSSANDARPAEIIEDLVNGVFADSVKEVLAIHKVAQCTSDQTEVGIGCHIAGVFPSRHSKLSIDLSMFNEVTLSEV